MCRFSDTGIALTSHNRCHARDSQKPCIEFLLCTIRRHPLRKLACRFRLHNISKRIDSCCNRIQLSMVYHALWDRRHSGATGMYVNALGRTRLVHWLILVAPSCLRSRNARYILLKSLNKHVLYPAVLNMYLSATKKIINFFLTVPVRNRKMNQGPSSWVPQKWFSGIFYPVMQVDSCFKSI